MVEISLAELNEKGAICKMSEKDLNPDDHEQMITLFEGAIQRQDDIIEQAEFAKAGYYDAIAECRKRINLQQVEKGDMKVIDGAVARKPQWNVLRLIARMFKRR